MAVQMELPKQHFANVIRMVKHVRLDQVEMIRHGTYQVLERLDVKRDMSRAVNKIPAGSDQHDIGSVLAWSRKVKEPREGADKAVLRDFKKAVKQVVAIDATAVARTGK